KFTDAVFGVREFSNDELEYFVRLGSGNGGEESWHCMCELGAVVHGLPKFFVALAGAQQDEIFDFVVGKLALAKHRVCKFGRPSNGHPKADRGFRPGRRGLAAAAGAAGNAARSASFWLFILSGLGVIAAGIS